jgi:hypothetical protein
MVRIQHYEFKDGYLYVRVLALGREDVAGRDHGVADGFIATKHPGS